MNFSLNLSKSSNYFQNMKLPNKSKSKFKWIVIFGKQMIKTVW